MGGLRVRRRLAAVGSAHRAGDGLSHLCGKGGWGQSNEEDGRRKRPETSPTRAARLAGS